MASLYPIALCGFIAAILTFCDLDSVFDAPPNGLQWKPWFQLRAWWWGFILVNALLASVLLFAIQSKGVLKDWNPWLASILVGFGYTALVRLQFTTLSFDGKNVPLGIEIFYEAMKKLVHKRINRIIRVWRMEQGEALAQSSIEILRTRALLMVASDALMKDEERNTKKAWIDQMADAARTPAADGKRAIALFIIMA